LTLEAFMTRFTLATVAALLVASAPALAQTGPAPFQAQTQAQPRPQLPEPGSEAWLRQRGESYSAAPDAEQDPAEVAVTEKLNSAIVANNDAAERAEAESAATHEAASARWREETARISTARAQWEADVAAANAARARYERDRAAWEADVAACRARGRVCLTEAPRY